MPVLPRATQEDGAAAGLTRLATLAGGRARPSWLGNDYYARMHINHNSLRGAAGARAGRGGVLAVATLACAALISACGSSSPTSSTETVSGTPVDTARVAASIEETVLKQRHIHVTVVCPTSVIAEKGKTFECIATSRAAKPPHALDKTPFVVTIETDRGYVTYVGK